MRSSGILLHPTSLAGPEGVGTLGQEARAFVDFLAAAGQRWWQVLPLNPPGPYESPYMASSAFAGNPTLVDLRTLAQDGWLEPGEVAEHPPGPVDWGAVLPAKRALLQTAAARFLASASTEERGSFDAFCDEHRGWLDDYALFSALGQAHQGAPWMEWPAAIRRREPSAIGGARHALRTEIDAARVAQFFFFSQWAALRAYATERGVGILGDMPIFVAQDSADVWANPDLFWLDEVGQPTVIAGVPPDYFSETGQLWGNPLYRWDVMAERGYRFWVERVRSAVGLVDQVRIDHFRGFEAYWEVPAGSETAIGGQWVLGPGRALFERIAEELGELPLLAEDLGLITAEVVALREGLGIPGMKVLQFAFGGAPTNPYLPHNFERDFVVYTGTHDNDTSAGWFDALDPDARHAVRRYLQSDGSEIAWDMIRLAWLSVANTAIAPMQDLLELGSEARINRPGSEDGNWIWRLEPGLDLAPTARRLREITELSGRLE
jgi:4-alpha-glucanotransferase